MTAVLEIRNLRKTYPGVVANDDVSLTVKAGEIHALLGENGAGKSTLVKASYGLIAPDGGKMRWQGAAYAPRSPNAARAAGIAMVFQHFSLFDALTVAENVALGMDHPPRLRDLAGEIARVSTAYGLPLDPNRRVGDLSAGEKQRVEIVRCLLQNPSLLIMDEPTSVLPPQAAETLFAALRRLKDPRPLRPCHDPAPWESGGDGGPQNGLGHRSGRDDGGAPPRRHRAGEPQSR